MTTDAGVVCGASPAVGGVGSNDASESLFLDGQTYEMEGCQVMVWHQ